MPMTPKQRKIALIEADVMMKEIARQLGVTGAHVSQVVAGDRRSVRVEQAVADAIGLPVEDVFDEKVGNVGSAA